MKRKISETQNKRNAKIKKNFLDGERRIKIFCPFIFAKNYKNYKFIKIKNFIGNYITIRRRKIILKIFKSVVEGRLYTRGSKRRDRGSDLSSNHKLGFRKLEDVK